MKFYFVRHGETDSNRTGRLQGHIDVPLNDTGRRQAASIEPTIQALNVTKLFHSPLKRAHETAQIINQNNKLEMISRDDLREWDVGSWGGLCVNEFRKFCAENKEPDNGETKTEYTKRVGRGINRILEQEKEPFILVAHGGVFQAMIKSLDAHTNISCIGNCEVVVFENSYEMWRAFTYEV